MKYPRSMALRIAAGLLGLAALGLSQGARAGGNVYWSVGVGVMPGVSVGVANAPPIYIHPPVYVQPAPVYIQPAPVYVQPAPVYLHPRPIYMPPVVYVQPGPVYGSHFTHDRHAEWWSPRPHAKPPFHHGSLHHGHGHGRGHGHGHGHGHGRH